MYVQSQSQRITLMSTLGLNDTYVDTNHVLMLYPLYRIYLSHSHDSCFSGSVKSSIKRNNIPNIRDCNSTGYSHIVAMPGAEGGLGIALVGERISVGQIQLQVTKLLGEGIS
jgi:hypothetical protein